MSRKTTDSLATEASFLAYSDADVEHDFLRIVSLFQQPGERVVPPTGWSRMLRRPPRVETSEPWHGHIVVVIDELDKLTANEDGVHFVEELLNGIKNLLTTRGVHFLFVAGPDLHDLALTERSRGNSVYDSVFGWQLYVPCVWDATDRLLDALVEPAPDGAEQLAALRDYLNFKARGVPRLLFMEFNSFVQWESGRARVVLAGPDLARIEFYAALERVLEAFLTASDEGHAYSVAIDEDRWRVGAYYVIDWILRTMGSTFTVDDIVSSDSRQSVDPLLVLSHKKVESLLDHLVAHEIVERVRGGGTSGTFYGDVPLAQTAVFRVAEDIGVKLAAFARVSERERADLGPLGQAGEARAQQPWADTDAGGVLRGGRYELREEVDRGGMGRVYRAHDRILDRQVAIKVLDDPTLLASDRMRARFERRGRLAVGLEHPNIVPTHETFTEEDGRPAIVMGWVEGVSLTQLLRRSRMRASEAVQIAAQLLQGLAYLDERGISRLDLKPSGILVDPSLRPVIIDLGLARQVDDDGEAGRLTTAGVFVGTPEYAPPELIQGEEADIRADLYTLGLILVEMLTGQPVRAGDGAMEVMLRAATEDVGLDDVDCSAALLAVLRTATARDPNARFPSCDAMREALLATPEGAQAAARAS
jgi:eukaryotic-like serine/threonine-protein kinase